MKQIASYTLSAKRTNENGLALDGKTVERALEDWLSEKGRPGGDDASILLPGNRRATVEREHWESSEGWVSSVSLIEPLLDGAATLRTSVSIGEGPLEVAVSLRMAVASKTMAPLLFEPKCPRFIQVLLQPPSPWQFNGLPLAAAPLNLTGQESGSRLSSLLWEQSRPIPVVVISDDDGVLLHPGIDEDLARDLAGLAIVATVDPEAAWQLTNERGREWSCFGGAIRLFWPGLTLSSNPLSNPLWTATRLLQESEGSASAAQRIRAQLRRLVFEQSALAVPEAQQIREVRSRASSEEIERFRSVVLDGRDNEELARLYSEEAERLTREVKSQHREITDLRERVKDLQDANKNLLQAHMWRDSSPDDVGPDTEIPPQSVEEAVNRAREELHEDLVFGSEVSTSVAGLTPDAGPPEKILSYLRSLAEMTRAKRAGTLGMNALQWLKERGVTASGESDTDLRSPTSRRARTWDNANGSKREFNYHLKPNDGTSPDRCVRIYFDHDVEKGVTVIGWVGRHL